MKTRYEIESVIVRVFDVCDQCDDGKLPPVLLRDLDQKRKTEKETISRFGMSEAARIMER